MASSQTLWPALETGYMEEFGPVDPEVHGVARDVWPRAERLAVDLLGDSEAGFRLLKRAVAAVSGLPCDRREEIRDPHAYLFQTYKRLVLAELEKLNGHRSQDLKVAATLRSLSVDADEIERQILVAELLHRMDPWSREIFENLALGYSFEEIGRALAANPHVVRNRFRLALRRLSAAVRQNVGAPTAKSARLRKSVAGSISRLRMMRTGMLKPSR